MDDRRSKLKKFIEDSDVPAELKVRELAIVDNQELSAPEIEMALTKLIAEVFDRKMEEAGITDIESRKEVVNAYNVFVGESEQAEKDLADDMKFVDENLKAIRGTAEEIQKAALHVNIKPKGA